MEAYSKTLAREVLGSNSVAAAFWLWHYLIFLPTLPHLKNSEENEIELRPEDNHSNEVTTNADEGLIESE